MPSHISISFNCFVVNGCSSSVDCSNIRSKYNILGFDSIFLVLSGNIVNSTLTFKLILHIVIPVFKLDMEFFTNHTKSSPEHPIIYAQKIKIVSAIAIKPSVNKKVANLYSIVIVNFSGLSFILYLYLNLES